MVWMLNKQCSLLSSQTPNLTHRTSRLTPKQRGTVLRVTSMFECFRWCLLLLLQFFLFSLFVETLRRDLSSLLTHKRLHQRLVPRAVTRSPTLPTVRVQRHFPRARKATSYRRCCAFPNCKCHRLFPPPHQRSSVRAKTSPATHKKATQRVWPSCGTCCTCVVWCGVVWVWEGGRGGKGEGADG